VMMIEKNEKENKIIAKTKDINELKKKLEE
jgi:hypothetical protein